MVPTASSCRLALLLLALILVLCSGDRSGVVDALNDCDSQTVLVPENKFFGYTMTKVTDCTVKAIGLTNTAFLLIGNMTRSTLIVENCNIRQINIADGEDNEQIHITGNTVPTDNKVTQMTFISLRVRALRLLNVSNNNINYAVPSGVTDKPRVFLSIYVKFGDATVYSDIIVRDNRYTVFYDPDTKKFFMQIWSFFSALTKPVFKGNSMDVSNNVVLYNTSAESAAQGVIKSYLMQGTLQYSSVTISGCLLTTYNVSNKAGPYSASAASAQYFVADFNGTNVFVSALNFSHNEFRVSSNVKTLDFRHRNFVAAIGWFDSLKQANKNKAIFTVRGNRLRMTRHPLGGAVPIVDDGDETPSHITMRGFYFAKSKAAVPLDRSGSTSLDYDENNFQSYAGAEEDTELGNFDVLGLYSSFPFSDIDVQNSYFGVSTVNLTMSRNVRCTFALIAMLPTKSLTFSGNRMFITSANIGGSSSVDFLSVQSYGETVAAGGGGGGSNPTVTVRGNHMKITQGRSQNVSLTTTSRFVRVDIADGSTVAKMEVVENRVTNAATLSGSGDMATVHVSSDGGLGSLDVADNYFWYSVVAKHRHDMSVVHVLVGDRSQMSLAHIGNNTIHIRQKYTAATIDNVLVTDVFWFAQTGRAGFQARDLNVSANSVEFFGTRTAQFCGLNITLAKANVQSLLLVDSNHFFVSLMPMLHQRLCTIIALESGASPGSFQISANNFTVHAMRITVFAPLYLQFAKNQMPSSGMKLTYTASDNYFFFDHLQDVINLASSLHFIMVKNVANDAVVELALTFTNNVVVANATVTTANADSKSAIAVATVTDGLFQTGSYLKLTGNEVTATLRGMMAFWFSGFAVDKTTGLVAVSNIAATLVSNKITVTMSTPFHDIIYCALLITSGKATGDLGTQLIATDNTFDFTLSHFFLDDSSSSTFKKSATLWFTAFHIVTNGKTTYKDVQVQRNVVTVATTDDLQADEYAVASITLLRLHPSRGGQLGECNVAGNEVTVDTSLVQKSSSSSSGGAFLSVNIGGIVSIENPTVKTLKIEFNTFKAKSSSSSSSALLLEPSSDAVAFSLGTFANLTASLALTSPNQHSNIILFNSNTVELEFVRSRSACVMLYIMAPSRFNSVKRGTNANLTVKLTTIKGTILPLNNVESLFRVCILDSTVLAVSRLNFLWNKVDLEVATLLPTIGAAATVVDNFRVNVIGFWSDRDLAADVYANKNTIRVLAPSRTLSSSSSSSTKVFVPNVTDIAGLMIRQTSANTIQSISPDLTFVYYAHRNLIHIESASAKTNVSGAVGYYEHAPVNTTTRITAQYNHIFLKTAGSADDLDGADIGISRGSRKCVSAVMLFAKGSVHYGLNRFDVNHNIVRASGCADRKSFATALAYYHGALAFGHTRAPNAWLGLKNNTVDVETAFVMNVSVWHVSFLDETFVNQVTGVEERSVMPIVIISNNRVSAAIVNPPESLLPAGGASAVKLAVDVTLAALEIMPMLFQPNNGRTFVMEDNIVNISLKGILMGHAAAGGGGGGGAAKIPLNMTEAIVAASSLSLLTLGFNHAVAPKRGCQVAMPGMTMSFDRNQFVVEGADATANTRRIASRLQSSVFKLPNPSSINTPSLLGPDSTHHGAVCDVFSKAAGGGTMVINLKENELKDKSVGVVNENKEALWSHRFSVFTNLSSWTDPPLKLRSELSTWSLHCNAWPKAATSAAALSLGPSTAGASEVSVLHRCSRTQSTSKTFYVHKSISLSNTEELSNTTDPTSSYSLVVTSFTRDATHSGELPTATETKVGSSTLQQTVSGGVKSPSRSHVLSNSLELTESAPVPLKHSAVETALRVTSGVTSAVAAMSVMTPAPSLLFTQSRQQSVEGLIAGVLRKDCSFEVPDKEDNPGPSESPTQMAIGQESPFRYVMGTVVGNIVLVVACVVVAVFLSWFCTWKWMPEESTDVLSLCERAGVGIVLEFSIAMFYNATLFAALQILVLAEKYEAPTEFIVVAAICVAVVCAATISTIKFTVFSRVVATSQYRPVVVYESPDELRKIDSETCSKWARYNLEQSGEWIPYYHRDFDISKRRLNKEAPAAFVREVKNKRRDLAQMQRDEKIFMMSEPLFDSYSGVFQRFFAMEVAVQTSLLAVQVIAHFIPTAFNCLFLGITTTLIFFMLLVYLVVRRPLCIRIEHWVTCAATFTEFLAALMATLFAKAEDNQWLSPFAGILVFVNLALGGSLVLIWMHGNSPQYRRFRDFCKRVCGSGAENKKRRRGGGGASESKIDESWIGRKFYDDSDFDSDFEEEFLFGGGRGGGGGSAFPAARQEEEGRNFLGGAPQQRQQQQHGASHHHHHHAVEMRSVGGATDGDISLPPTAASASRSDQQAVDDDLVELSSSSAAAASLPSSSPDNNKLVDRFEVLDVKLRKAFAELYRDDVVAPPPDESYEALKMKLDEYLEL